jgi:N-acetylneuraminate synthase|nr:N-acetylneuraminate synthase family protein [Kofleriaceae bacterium]
MAKLEIGRPVGEGHPPFIVAAIDGVELGSLEAVLAAIDDAANSRCDAVKLRTLPWAWCVKTFERAEARGLSPLARALDEETVYRLDWCGAPAFALQFDWSDLDLIAAAARTGKPLFVSVGRASDDELAEVVETARSNGNGGIALLQPAGAGLDRLASLQRTNAVVGVLDYVGVGVAREAISRGAAVIVKPWRPSPQCDLAALVRDCEAEYGRGVAPRWVTN